MFCLVFQVAVLKVAIELSSKKVCLLPRLGAPIPWKLPAHLLSPRGVGSSEMVSTS
jgi:hypothetical protein